MASSNNTNVIAWLGLSVAIVALLFAVVAFNRVEDTSIDDNVEQKLELVTQETRQGVAVIRSNVQLERVATELEEANYKDALETVREVRSDMREVYEDTAQASTQWWQNFDQEMENLEQQIEEESQESVSALDRVMERLRESMNSDS